MVRVLRHIPLHNPDPSANDVACMAWETEALFTVNAATVCVSPTGLFLVKAMLDSMGRG